MKEAEEEKNITVNRKARHEYFIVQTLEAGISLLGTEVKSCRQNKANLTDAFAAVRDGEVWLMNCHISHYDRGNINNHDPVRKRRLLLKKSEMRKILLLLFCSPFLGFGQGPNLVNYPPLIPFIFLHFHLLMKMLFELDCSIFLYLADSKEEFQGFLGSLLDNPFPS